MKIHIEILDDSHKKLLELKKEGRSLNWLVDRAVGNYIKARFGSRLVDKK